MVSATIPDEIREKKLFLLDLDGTFALDGKPFPKSVELIDWIHKNDRLFVFMTNNSSKSHKSYLQNLRSMGIKLSSENVLTSNQVAGRFLTDRYSGNSVVYLGTMDGAKELIDMGIEAIMPFDRFRSLDPQVALIAYDVGLTYEKLRNFCLFLREGISYFATHPDINYPSKDGLLPDCGSYIELIAASTGRRPDQIFGKPHLSMYHDILQRHQILPKDTLIIGDRLYTDIQGGINTGIETLLVLTGETQIADIAESPLKPTFCLPSLEAFYDWLVRAENGK